MKHSEMTCDCAHPGLCELCGYDEAAEEAMLARIQAEVDEDNANASAWAAAHPSRKGTPHV